MHMQKMFCTFKIPIGQKKFPSCSLNSSLQTDQLVKSCTPFILVKGLNKRLDRVWSRSK